MLGHRSYIRSVDPDQPRPFEADLYVCGHCRKIQHAPPPNNAKLHTGIPEALGALCHGCGKMICLQCAAMKRCIPNEVFIQKLEEKWRRMNER